MDFRCQNLGIQRNFVRSDYIRRFNSCSTKLYDVPYSVFCLSAFPIFGSTSVVVQFDENSSSCFVVFMKQDILCNGVSPPYTCEIISANFLLSAYVCILEKKANHECRSAITVYQNKEFLHRVGLNSQGNHDENLVH